jgi:hypothetical protein
MKTLRYFMLFIGLLFSGGQALAEEVTLNFAMPTWSR